MIKHRPPPSKVDHRKEQYEELLAAMGVDDAANRFTRFALEQELDRLKHEYARRVAQLSRLPNRKLALRYRAAVTKTLALSKVVGPDFLTEIEEAGWSRHNPTADASDLHMAIIDNDVKLRDWIAELTGHRLDIDHWLKTTGDAYKKRDVRKLVVEPFLRLIAQHEIMTSRGQLPRSRMFQALFDWLGIAEKFRLSNAAINAIARELEGDANASKSNAKRRTRK